MLFPTPAPLIATAQILYDIAAESQYYSLTKVRRSIKLLLPSPYKCAGELLVFRVYDSGNLNQEFWSAVSERTS